MAAESVTSKQAKESMVGTWDGEIRKISIFAENLQQLDNGKKIPPTGWKCEKCDLTNNLWLNLSDGSIMCGRKFHDGSGGNDHAVQHYQQFKYPLAVKLGTITPDGKGDVYSYEEDDMVENPNLIKHLGHFGIKVNQLEKTEKSMVELEIDINNRIGEWSAMTESSSNLVPISGPGYTGMKNLGNSCYLNSVMQVKIYKCLLTLIDSNNNDCFLYVHRLFSLYQTLYNDTVEVLKNCFLSIQLIRLMISTYKCI